MFGLGTLLEACLLFVNAVAVLHEERFLKKYGLLWDHYYDDFFFGPPGIKVQIIRLINAVRTVMRVPLIAINIFAIVYLLLLG
ncbi:unnamed protein product [Oikopleura dioica]|uniref:Immediate early response 3-interacting protein 1 n=1 Tax=Oikopleura dioica TaxID=34765 RepID=E4Z071_OIKDI|nr:unnamed protein product [Oikopleura dioica]